MKPFAVVFAGVPGTSKTPISHYLSCGFELPIFNNDQVRYEVREDLRLKNINLPGGVEEFEKRRKQRIGKILSEKKSTIFDSSVDRKWAELKQSLAEANYGWFMVNMELSKPFLVKFFAETGREAWADKNLEIYLDQHKRFINAFSSDISIEINDDTFADRLSIAGAGLKDFLASRIKK